MWCNNNVELREGGGAVAQSVERTPWSGGRGFGLSSLLNVSMILAETQAMISSPLCLCLAARKIVKS